MATASVSQVLMEMLVKFVAMASLVVKSQVIGKQGCRSALPRVENRQAWAAT